MDKIIRIIKITQTQIGGVPKLITLSPLRSCSKIIITTTLLVRSVLWYNNRKLRLVDINTEFFVVP